MKLSDSKSIGHIIVDYKSSIRINDEEDIKKLELTYPKEICDVEYLALLEKKISMKV